MLQPIPSQSLEAADPAQQAANTEIVDGTKSPGVKRIPTKFLLKYSNVLSASKAPIFATTIKSASYIRVPLKRAINGKHDINFIYTDEKGNKVYKRLKHADIPEQLEESYELQCNAPFSANASELTPAVIIGEEVENLPGGYKYKIDDNYVLRIQCLQTNKQYELAPASVKAGSPIYGLFPLLREVSEKDFIEF